ncbi:MAG: hypothetical protein AAB263_22305 [Planctomycetota bacterium]
MLHLGIDEAGYGPTLGPLAIVAAAAVVTDPLVFRDECAELGIADSKLVHAGGNFARLESVALSGLTWLTGSRATNAAEVFSCFGESSAARAAIPWMAGAHELSVPVSRATIVHWSPRSAQAHGVFCRLLHPRQLNVLRRKGVNRASAELEVVRELLAAAITTPALPAAVTCDRLGGRLRYGDLLSGAWPGRHVTTLAETAAACRYQCGETTVAFVVDGESAAPLVALASCIAKYARELHMHLFNAFWSTRVAGLAPTAGYPNDAKRWLTQVGAALPDLWRHELVRDGRSA